ncbi:uncharacterized protein isoform X3 [Danio rerio]|uniref:Uncharacterized protein isoform X3 n=1 Tax=Danio rerio TaxID=7955 RepID=A0AC58IRX3_DANRE
MSINILAFFTLTKPDTGAVPFEKNVFSTIKVHIIKEWINEVDESANRADCVTPDAVLISVYLPVVGVLLLLLLLSSVCVCWRAAEMQKGCGITCGRCHEEWTLDSVQGVKSLNDWTLAEVLYAPIQSNKSS